MCFLFILVILVLQLSISNTLRLAPALHIVVDFEFMASHSFKLSTLEMGHYIECGTKSGVIMDIGLMHRWDFWLMSMGISDDNEMYFYRFFVSFLIFDTGLTVVCIGPSLLLI